MKVYLVASCWALAAMNGDSFVVGPAGRMGTEGTTAIGLVPEQAKELEAYYECECEILKKQTSTTTMTEVEQHVKQDDDTATAVVQSRRRRGPAAWCLRVWHGPSMAASTSRAAHHPPSQE